MSTSTSTTPDIEEATIHFTKSNVTALWRRAENLPILRVAENAGLKPDYGCRSGACGTCEVKLLKGQVEGPEGDYERGILICSSRPTSREVEIEL